MRRAIIISILALVPVTSWASGFYLPRWLDWLLSIGTSCEQPCGAEKEGPREEPAPEPAPQPEPPASDAEEQQELKE